MEYALPERRTTKKDLNRKREYIKYKKGGSLRTQRTDTIKNGK